MAIENWLQFCQSKMKNERIFGVTAKVYTKSNFSWLFVSHRNSSIYFLDNCVNWNRSEGSEKKRKKSEKTFYQKIYIFIFCSPFVSNYNFNFSHTLHVCIRSHIQHTRAHSPIDAAAVVEVQHILHNTYTSIAYDSVCVCVCGRVIDCCVLRTLFYCTLVCDVFTHTHTRNEKKKTKLNRVSCMRCIHMY